MNTTILIVTAVVISVVTLVVISRRSKPTGDKRYVKTRRRGGRREVYDSETNTWVLMALVLSDLDIDTSCYNDIYTGGSNGYSSSSCGESSSYTPSSSYDSGSSFSGGSDSSYD